MQESLERIEAASQIRELATDETAHKFELVSPQDADLRAELYRLVVAKNWTLLELRRDTQTLDAVFRDLTRNEGLLDRGEDWMGEEEDDEEDFEDEDDEDLGEDDDQEDDEPDEDENDSDDEDLDEDEDEDERD